MNKFSHHGNAGFTLIEIMIVVVIIAILASIALPSYRDHVTKTRRTAGAGCMMEAAQFMERYYTTHMTYVGATLPALGCVSDTSRWYTISLKTGTTTASTFTLQAVPTGAQNDPKCGTLSIDQKGTKSKTGTYSTASQCF